MTNRIFIRAASCISPQPTFGSATLPTEIISSDERKFSAIEPDYKTHLNIPSARRMSRLIKMGVCSALNCLENAGIKIPDAIICGTGLGCMEDSEKFLASLIENNEQTLSPTSFIFSTHNTVAAQIALLLKCNNYNFTHTHRGLSFENSLLDAILFLNDHRGSKVLAGATDEVTATSFKIMERLGLTRNGNENIPVSGNRSGTIAGEGAVFFSLTDQSDTNNLAELKSVFSFSNPKNEKEISDKILDFIQRNNIDENVFILTGINGDDSGDKIYHSILQSHFDRNPNGNFKHLCGEYHTATAFATWLGALMLKEQHVPAYIYTRDLSDLKRIIIFNHYKGREFSLILLEKC